MKPRLFVSEQDAAGGGYMRPAEVSDLVEALRAVDTTDVVRRCDAHDDVAAYGNPDACRAGVNANDEVACVMESVLVVPLGEDTE